MSTPNTQTPFLKYVAKELLQLHPEGLQDVAVIFQNKRAGIFFNDYLLEASGGAPVWAPRYFTINDLFDNLCPLKKVDDIKAVCTLYNVVCKEMKIDDDRKQNDFSLDFFYGWGHQLLSDFSDIDRSMVDAGDLFFNWEGLEELEQWPDDEYEQLKKLCEILQGKVGNSSGESKVKKDFQEIWQHLHAIYDGLNRTLEKENLAYEGRRQRVVVDGLKKDESPLKPFRQYVFVGFNMLLPVERELFHILKGDGEKVKQHRRALFYWDYDVLYCNKNLNGGGMDAPFHFGEAMKRNLSDFGQDLEADCFDNFSNHEPLDFVAVQSNTAQTRFASQWLKKNLTDEERRTAVVLCDENLLQPMIHSLPDNVKDVNVTKGFPLSHTPAFTFVSKWLGRNKANRKEENVDGIERLERLSSALQKEALMLQEKYPENSWMEQLTAESFFQCFKTVNMLKDYVADGTLTVGWRTLSALLLQILGTLSIPFHGEPARGLQIMGMLETRNLDFENVLLLSVGEGVVPQKRADRSFIPFILRLHHHIMTNQDRSEVYAYNFFRLLQRARRATLVYNASSDGANHSGERSRFMTQILAQTDIPVKYFNLTEQNNTLMNAETEIDSGKAREIMKKRSIFLSASALNDYISCPAKYYFRHVMHLREVEEDNVVLPLNIFGSIFHKAAELVYLELTGGNFPSKINPKNLENIIEKRLDNFVSKAFDEINNEEPNSGLVSAGTVTYSAEEHPVEFGVIRDYLKKLLELDKKCAGSAGGLTILGLEEYQNCKINDHLRIIGNLDRRDRIGNVDRVVDYKTGKFDEQKMKVGGKNQKAGPLDVIFSNSEKRYLLQTLFYVLLCKKSGYGIPQPELFFLQKLNNNYDGRVDYGAPFDENLINAFEEKLIEKVEEMRVNKFTKDGIKKNFCRTCPYTLLCNVRK